MQEVELEPDKGSGTTCQKWVAVIDNLLSSDVEDLLHNWGLKLDHDYLATNNLDENPYTTIYRLT